MIEIRDDGSGLDPKALVAKAIEKGVVSPEDHLTDQQAFALIFAPGFSTAATVTDISGRGVGMDVVRRNIEPPPHLGAAVDVDFILGMGKVKEEVKILLDIDKVLSSGEFVEVREASQTQV